MTTNTESDIILNRANVALARSQRLVASWLPARTPDELPDSTKTEEDLRREEDEIFTAVPETLGLGAPLPKTNPDGSWERSELGSNERLRKQLLGKNYKRVGKEAAGADLKRAGGDSTASSGAATPSRKPAIEEEEDEEEGRASMVGRKGRTSGSNRSETTQPPLDNVDESEEGLSTKKAASTRGKKKATSFLDEVLAERSKKRKKR